MGELSLIQKVAAWVIPVLFAITVHEVAHGWVAKQLGDRTAMMLGRLTLNPIKHIDPIGTIVVPLVTLLFSGFVIGWARPVPVAWNNLRRPKRDMAIVAAAGPAANLAMLALWTLVLKLMVLYHATVPWVAEPLIYMSIAGIVANAVLMIINLVPIPPLDGGRVLTGFLPGRAAYLFSRIEPFGMIIIIALLVTGVLGRLIGPAVGWFVFLPVGVVGISGEVYEILLGQLLGR